jgi:hypothetical protein
VAALAAGASATPPPQPGIAPGAANVSGTDIQHVGVTGFTAAGGATGSSPALADNGSALVGFARGTNNALWYHQFLQSTPGWHSLGGVITTGIGAFAYNPTPDTFILAAYALGSDGQVWQHTDLASGTWSRVTP